MQNKNYLAEQFLKNKAAEYEKKIIIIFFFETTVKSCTKIESIVYNYLYFVQIVSY